MQMTENVADFVTKCIWNTKPSYFHLKTSKVNDRSERLIWIADLYLHNFAEEGDRGGENTGKIL